MTPVQGPGIVQGATETHQRPEVPVPRFIVIELAEPVKGKQLHDLAFAGIRNGPP